VYEFSVTLVLPLP